MYHVRTQGTQGIDECMTNVCYHYLLASLFRMLAVILVSEKTKTKLAFMLTL